MATIIAHASIDENGNVKGGKVGDQTGKEVCLRNWYSKPWSFVIRAKNKDIASKAAKLATQIANNNNCGYSQIKRNSLYKELKKVKYDVSKLSVCDTDCSAFVTTCYIGAGITSLGNDINLPTTSTMRNVYASTGMFDILTDTKYTQSDAWLEVGYILVKPGSHTVIVVQVEKLTV